MRMDIMIGDMVQVEVYKLENAKKILEQEKELMASMISDNARPHEIARWITQRADDLQRAAQEVENITKNIEQLNNILEEGELK